MIENIFISIQRDTYDLFENEVSIKDYFQNKTLETMKGNVEHFLCTKCCN